MDEGLLRDGLAALRDVLMPATIPWAVAAGAAVYLYTNNRMPADVDVLVRPEDVESVSRLIGPPAKMEATSWGEVSVVRTGRVEIAGALLVRQGRDRYRYEMDADMLARLRFLTYHGIEVPVLSPEDLVALKAVLQRGSDQGKHDLEDIDALTVAVPIDLAYLRLRLERMGAMERAGPVMQRWAAARG